MHGLALLEDHLPWSGREQRRFRERLNRPQSAMGYPTRIVRIF